MSVNCEFLYDGYKATKAWRGDSAVLLAYVSGLDENIQPDEALSASGILLGAKYPFGTAITAVCMEITVLDRPTTSQAWVLIRFDTDTAWGGNPTRLVIEFSSTQFDEMVPIWRSLPTFAPISGGGFVSAYAFQRLPDVKRIRTVNTRRVYKFIGGEITDLQINYINQQRNKLYIFGGVPYLFVDCSARSNPNGLSVLQYRFQNTGGLPAIPAGTSQNRGDLDIPATPPLAVLNGDPNQFPRYRVSNPNTDYEPGGTLP